jgi:hypothetical protein
MPVVLAATALWPPLSVVRIAYALALVVAVDGSFGLNGGYYPLLYTYVAPYRGLRVPARFSLLVGLTLSLLAGYGAARILGRWPRQRMLLTAVMLALIMLEAMPRMPLERVWRNPPPIYTSISSEPTAVIAEFPMPTAPVTYFFDTRYLYFSTFHWHPIVNGNSGYFPKSYEELTKHELDFPSDSVSMRARGVVTSPGGALSSRRRFQRIARSPRARYATRRGRSWEGGESRLYRLNKLSQR